MNYFLLLSTKKSFDLIKKFKDDFPYEYASNYLKDFPTLKLKFFDFIKFNLPEYLKDKNFLNENIILYKELKLKSDLLFFVKDNFKNLDKVKTLKALQESEFYEVFAFIYENLHNFIKAFEYNLILYESYHRKESYSENTVDFINKLEQNLRMDDNIIKKIIKNLEQKRESILITDFKKKINDETHSIESNNKKFLKFDSFKSSDTLSDSSISNKSFKELCKKLKNKEMFSLDKILKICEDTNHYHCNKFKINILIKIFEKIKTQKIIDRILSISNLDNKILQIVLSTLNFSEIYMKNTEYILNENLKEISYSIYGQGQKIRKECNLCGEKFLKEGNNSLIILKPKCGHITHYDCMNYYIKKLKSSGHELYKEINQKNQFQNCITCSKIKELFVNVNNTNSENKMSRNLDEFSIIEKSLNTAYDGVKVLTTGIQKSLDFLITFGNIEKEEIKKKIIRKKSLTRVKSESNISKGIDFETWTNSLPKNSLAIRLEKLKNDDEYKNIFVDFDD